MKPKNTLNNRRLACTLWGIPRVMKTGFHQTVMIFGHVSSDGSMMPSLWHQFRWLYEADVECGENSAGEDCYCKTLCGSSVQFLSMPLECVRSSFPRISTTSPELISNLFIPAIVISWITMCGT